MLCQQRRFGGSERAAGSSQCFGCSVERAHEAYPVVPGCASDYTIEEIRISLHSHQCLTASVGAAFEIGPCGRRAIRRGYHFEGGGHDRRNRQAAEELCGKGIVISKRCGHSAFVLVSAIAYHFHVPCDNRRRTQLREHTVIPATAAVVKLAVPRIRQTHFEVQRGRNRAVDLAVSRRCPVGVDESRRERGSADGFSRQARTGHLCRNWRSFRIGPSRR